MNNLVPIQKTEFMVGEPIPWPIYDIGNNMLLNEGAVIQSRRHLDSLYEIGVYRNPSVDVQTRRQAMPMSKSLSEEKGTSDSRRKPSQELKFSDMNLRLGERLQLQEVAGEKDRHLAKVVGYLDSHSLIVTHPTRGGEPLVFLDRQPLIVRGFSGKHAFAFETRLLKSYPAPYPHLHLASPKHVEMKEVRGSERISCNIIASVAVDSDPHKLSHAAMMKDLSLTGTRVTAKEALGGKGAEVVLKFRCQGNISDEYLSIRGILRNIDCDAQDGGVLHGVEFIELQNSDRLVLENMIYHLRFEEV